ncbi:hypothetical protein BJV85_002769 [Clostridium acetobutylicum]|uniref:Uncharacterized protein n=1 Tax=Clostridium acetobutylicum (strain ATCC 824 / DSM 792 / JCM 1419 / IAM 19013 / LMG 5710 / NBRC 13948 / NRRL B-527 / VKM B-1787 / 2291 / W) TaxID=272562 RepID=Q97JP6_CLOAB|nr:MULTISPECIES: hypothetical protein [Clostridium]AAK79199.1 Hypothetical protein CA_C1227 [Clostridium acetobutylicum ATCC 824]ADZ20278.1 Conserved hypothetical protein [Clostridium acetobutylicum EA 2018]AEI31727.1 hypothetical protein SMB_G1248 [Clostridium acetobutylicum DSM 1731]AWV81550.1 hypothetical protein DK921_15915 [Clostridium acetobutylicum]MBC2393190.1 hypothetical protein [Clostridium acetobutylicum]
MLKMKLIEVNEEKQQEIFKINNSASNISKVQFTHIGGEEQKTDDFFKALALGYLRRNNLID